ncbi:Aste57867_18938 [Aphanomyces stellatus]|uniref:Aste57867_18938 protein n=1 Tax=Aphanomyces stellatus TaxID=120398 RepID=A0A485LBL8_9STRA|nr:hypothetical protein As57867_018874 [Aphanomyces stellatus]VFT95669.1 Aste57867_18938 [Aphanomyces stellatus]
MNDDDAAFLVSALCLHNPTTSLPFDPTSSSHVLTSPGGPAPRRHRLSLDVTGTPKLRSSSAADDDDTPTAAADPNDAAFFHNLDLMFGCDAPPHAPQAYHPPFLSLSPLPHPLPPLGAPPMEPLPPPSAMLSAMAAPSSVSPPYLPPPPLAAPLALAIPPPYVPPPAAPPVQRFHVRLTTSFLPRYWKNGRKNLQCFPFCPEHGDFYEMKIQGKKHASVGVCRTPVNCELHCPLWLPRLHVVARFEQISPGTPVSPPPLLRGMGEFDAFRQDTFDAVQIGKCTTVPHGGGCTSTWMFLPDVWKLQPLLRKKRKATRSVPAETFPFYFRVFCFLQSPADNTNPVDWFRCVAECQSSAFELSSTRTADRHRKVQQ